MGISGTRGDSGRRIGNLNRSLSTIIPSQLSPMFASIGSKFSTWSRNFSNSYMLMRSCPILLPLSIFLSRPPLPLRAVLSISILSFLGSGCLDDALGAALGGEVAALGMCPIGSCTGGAIGIRPPAGPAAAGSGPKYSKRVVLPLYVLLLSAY